MKQSNPQHNFGSHTPLQKGAAYKEHKQLEAVQMLFLRPILGFIRRDKQRNIDIRNKLNHDSIVDGIRNYQQNCLQHVNRMEKNRLP